MSKDELGEKRRKKGEKHRYKKRHRRPDKPGYQSNLTNEEWEIIRDYIPEAKAGGCPRKHSKRRLLEGILYILRAGCQWRMLPKDFPPWQTVYYYFLRWGREGVIEKVHDILRREARKKAGREEIPSAVIVDSQSVKTTSKGGRAATTPVKRSMAASGI